MPVEIGPAVSEGDEPQDVTALLFKDDGETLTLEGEIIHDFLDDVDFETLFDDPEVRESGIVKTGEHWLVEKNGELEPSVEGAEGAKLYPVESIDPEVIAKIVDAEDLLVMFEYHIENELGSETLEEKARLAAAQQLLGYEVDEAKGPFKRGDFRKMHKAGAKDQVMRMLLAMINKQSIQRVAKGTGYKAGDYKKHPAGYAPGTPAGIKRWQKYRKAKAGKIKQAAKKAIKGKRLIGAKKGFKKAVAKKGAAAGLAKKGAGAGKRAISASEEPRKAKRLLEGAALAGKLTEHVTDGRAPRVEAAKGKTGGNA